MNFDHSPRLLLEVLAYPYPGRSTNCQFSLIRKWLINWVLPGVCEVFASPFRCTSMLISEDLPTFERPIKAYSGNSGAGNLSVLVLLH